MANKKNRRTTPYNLTGLPLLILAEDKMILVGKGIAVSGKRLASRECLLLPTNVG